MRAAGYFIVTEELFFDGTLLVVLKKLKEKDYVLDCIERDFRQPNTFKVFGTGPMFEKIGEGMTNPLYDLQLFNPKWDRGNLISIDIEITKV